MVQLISKYKYVIFNNKDIIVKQIVLISLFCFTNSVTGFNQTNDLKYSNKLTIVSGLTQPIFLNGFNIAANYTTNRWVFEYSHGIRLDYSGQALKADYKDNVVSLLSPYSTGPGIGYRIFSNDIFGMDIRAEAKLHQYDVQLNDREEISYTNFDLGGGAYWQIRPFGHRENLLKGIVIEPSIRYWANVSSSLEQEFIYTTNDGRSVEHKPYPLDLFFNISIGYTLGTSKR